MSRGYYIGIGSEMHINNPQQLRSTAPVSSCVQPTLLCMLTLHVFTMPTPRLGLAMCSSKGKARHASPRY